MASPLRALLLASFLGLSALAACSDGGEGQNATVTVKPGKAGSGGDGSGGSLQGGEGGQGEAGGGGSPAGAAGSPGAGAAGSPAGAGGSPAAGAGGSPAGSGGMPAAGAGGEPSAGSGGAGSGGAAGGAGSGAGAAGAGAECAPLTFPSGITIQQKKDPALTALYAGLGVSACAVPECFIDASDLKTADGSPLSVSVSIAANFKLYELIRDEIDPKKTGDYDPTSAYSARVLVSPELVATLQKMREIFAGPVNVLAAYRSPQHQKAICNSACGADECVENGLITCARNSRHLWGAAADVDVKYEAAAKEAGFPFVFSENGDTGPRLHLDMLKCE